MKHHMSCAKDAGADGATVDLIKDRENFKKIKSFDT